MLPPTSRWGLAVISSLPRIGMPMAIPCAGAMAPTGWKTPIPGQPPAGLMTCKSTRRPRWTVSRSGSTDQDVTLDGNGTFDLSSVTDLVRVNSFKHGAESGSLTVLLPNLVDNATFDLDGGETVAADIQVGSGNDTFLAEDLDAYGDTLRGGAGIDRLENAYAGTATTGAYDLHIDTTTTLDSVLTVLLPNLVDNATFDLDGGETVAADIQFGSGNDIFLAEDLDAYGDTLRGGAGTDRLVMGPVPSI